jgi:hypothetical protein
LTFDISAGSEVRKQSKYRAMYLNQHTEKVAPLRTDSSFTSTPDPVCNPRSSTTSSIALKVKMARTFNEVYRSYNSHQYPFILIDLKLASGTFDINLTPDKRTILLHEEQTLIKELNVSTHILRDLMVGSPNAVLRLVSAFPADESIHPIPQTTQNRDYQARVIRGRIISNPS